MTLKSAEIEPTEKPGTFQVHLTDHLARAILRLIFRSLLHILGQLEMQGRENVPKQEPYRIVINHVSIFDPPLVIAFWPICPEAVGTGDIWSKPEQATLEHLHGGIPAKLGPYDRHLIEQILQVINTDRVIVIASEGGRSHQPGSRQSKPVGAYIIKMAMQVLHISVLVVPVGITGTTDDFFQHTTQGKRPPSKINIKKSFELPGIEEMGKEHRLKRQENTHLIMTKIASLLPPAYRGVYARALQ